VPVEAELLAALHDQSVVGGCGAEVVAPAGIGVAVGARIGDERIRTHAELKGELVAVRVPGAGMERFHSTATDGQPEGTDAQHRKPEVREVLSVRGCGALQCFHRGEELGFG
jgi:hypothetical protein